MHALVYRSPIFTTPLIFVTKVITFASWVILAAIVLGGPEIAAIISGAFMTFNTLLMVYLERKHTREHERHEEKMVELQEEKDEEEKYVKDHERFKLNHESKQDQSKHSHYDHLRRG